MNFKEIQKGVHRSFDVGITEEMIDAFAALSGDKNPLHMDHVFAAEYGHSNRVVHGMLTASFYSTLVGMYIPGDNALLLGLNIQFTNPVYPGDALTITGEVSDVNETFRRIEIKARVTNQNGTLVSRAKIQTGLLYD